MSRRIPNRASVDRASRRDFLSAMGRFGSIVSLSSLLPGLPAVQALQRLAATAKKSGAVPTSATGFSFKDIAKESGLAAGVNVFGGVDRKQYILEETGCGVALFDYDNDGWLDIFMVNGSRIEGIPGAHPPTNFLFHNKRDGTFTDVTAKAGLAKSGWGQGCCIGCCDNEGCGALDVRY